MQQPFVSGSRNMQRREAGVFSIAVLLCFLGASCGTSRSQDTREIKNPESSGSVSGCRLSTAEVDRFRRALGDYELLDVKDFNIPIDLISDHYLKIDIQDWLWCRIVKGDFDNDGSSNNFAAIGRHRAGGEAKVVIIKVQDDHTPQFSLVTPNRDLTRSMLSVSRSGLSLRVFDENGKIKTSNIIWDKGRKEYSLASE